MKETVEEVINSRMHRYDDLIQASCSEEFHGFMKGWYSAYQDILEIMKQNDFDTEQVLIDYEKRDKKDNIPTDKMQLHINTVVTDDTTIFNIE